MDKNEVKVHKVKAITEFEKMRNEEFYDFTSEECLANFTATMDYLCN